MGKVKVIQKSRKECKCGRCGNIIPVGSTYYRGVINFNPDIIRCANCKLEGWEVTTSDYQLSVGEIVNRWRETYGCDETTPDSIRDELETIRDDQQERLDNMPENLQYSETGELIQSRIDCLEAAMDSLESIDIDSCKEEVIDDYNSSVEEDEQVEEVNWDEPDNELFDFQEKLNEVLEEKIEEALSEIEY